MTHGLSPGLWASFQMFTGKSFLSSCTGCSEQRMMTPGARIGASSRNYPFAKSHLTLCDPMDCSPPGSSVHEISQARILEWVVISFSRESIQPRDQTCVSYVS